MSAPALAKLTRAIDELERSVAVNRYEGIDRQTLKSDLEGVIQRLDELRQRL